MGELKEIMIMGRKIKIEWRSKSWENHGQFFGDSNKIVLNRSLLKKGREIQLKDTLAHECFHAVLFYTGLTNLLDENQEEAITRGIEYNFIPALQNIYVNNKEVDDENK